MSRKQAQSNPYVAFRDDQERRRALMSRDIRIAFVAVVLTIAAIFGSDRGVHLPVVESLKRLSLAPDLSQEARQASDLNAITGQAQIPLKT